ncbi:hypothetical protein P43SY_009332 [Pythium insidiosum]|uniref:Uncharacterized protein n=1 Tax=Pythium insidiosum TaxID=114742 RepID=A0AAD5LWV3_PYTIN|nr:hypothetical protein P43SY_009332 [Pythium insidiosum]
MEAPDESSAPTPIAAAELAVQDHDTVTAAAAAAASPMPSSSLDGDTMAAAAAGSGSVIDDTAFASWREGFTAQLAAESTAVRERMIALQLDFDEASHYIRGDYAWRKQLAAFHDRSNDALTAHLAEMVERLQARTVALAASLEETLQTKERAARLEMDRHVQRYEDKLRRTRTSMRKEMERCALLERCLRRDEAQQARAMYDRLVQQLNGEHAAREAALQAVIRELKSSHASMEHANTQLMASMSGAREEIAQLKALLPKLSTPSGGSPRATARASVVIPSGSAAFATTALAVSAAPDLVQSLQTAVDRANEAAEGLRRQVEELTKDRDACLRRQRLAEDAAARAKDELLKVQQLLTESRDALLRDRAELARVELDRSTAQARVAELEFRAGSHAETMSDSSRLNDALKQRASELETELQAMASDLHELLRCYDQFSSSRDAETSKTALDSAVARCRRVLSGVSVADPAPIADAGESELDRRLRVEAAKLRVQFETRYTEQLNVRISHERRRVTARVEMLWSKQPPIDSSSTASKRPAGGRPREEPSARPVKLSCKAALALMHAAFEDIGFGEWSDSDVESLRAEIALLRHAVDELHGEMADHKRRNDVQAIALARAELAQREKELLLRELTERYRELRAVHEAWTAQQEDEGASVPSVEPAVEPLTVVGHVTPTPQSTTRVAPPASRLSPRRTDATQRPVSASATLAVDVIEYCPPKEMS